MDTGRFRIHSGYDSAGGGTDPGTVEIRDNWMVGSDKANRLNRKQSGWKNSEHIVLTDPIEDGFIEEIWSAVVARDKFQPCIQKLYVNNGNQSQYSMYDAHGKVGEGFLSELLVFGFIGKKVKIAEFARAGFELFNERNLWKLTDLEYLCDTQSGSDFKTHAVPILKAKHGIPDETKINGHQRYYEDVVFPIYGSDYYLTKEWYRSAYDILANWFLERGLTLREIVEKIQHQGAFMFRDDLGPIQKIVYGAPGTGKSFSTDGKLKDRENNPKAVVYRTTFHPDSDYASFVGVYKPAMSGTNIVYAFRPQAFMEAYVKAWRILAGKEDTHLPVALVIEEINRGHCAQVFGDLFQLLDRDDATGYSTYPIVADIDLSEWLKKDAQFGIGLTGINKPECIKQADWDMIVKGQMLVLPPNLHIWATMNTSDQSLFPIDSAFKRRWDWKYVPIVEPDKSADPDWRRRAIKVKDRYYDWWTFLTIINHFIETTTKSEDKQLGYFFVKAPDATGIITADQFVNKVLFYLFGDVFKDWKLPEAVFGKGDGKFYSFRDFFGKKVDEINEDAVVKFLEKMEWKDDQNTIWKMEPSNTAPQTNVEQATSKVTEPGDGPAVDGTAGAGAQNDAEPVAE